MTDSSLSPFDCPVCRNLFKGPCFLPHCQHSYCYTCIKDVTSHQDPRKEIKCTVCQKVNTFEDELEIETVKRNYGLAGVVECLKRSHIDMKKEIKQNCFNFGECGRQAEFYCYNEKDYMCEDCKKELHPTALLLSRHKIVLSSEMKSVSPFCHEHTTEKVMFCKYCVGVVCVDCHFSRLPHHTAFSPIDAEVEKLLNAQRSTKLNDMIVELKKKEDILTKERSKLEDKIRLVDLQVKQVKSLELNIQQRESAVGQLRLQVEPRQLLSEAFQEEFRNERNRFEEKVQEQYSLIEISFLDSEKEKTEEKIKERFELEIMRKNQECQKLNAELNKQQSELKKITEENDLMKAQIQTLKSELRTRSEEDFNPFSLVDFELDDPFSQRTKKRPGLSAGILGSSLAKGEKVQPRQKVQQTWVFVNNGQKRWPETIGLGKIGGSEFANSKFENKVAVENSRMEVTITFTAPATEGMYSASYRLIDPDSEPFGQVAKVQIEVTSKATTPTRSSIPAVYSSRIQIFKQMFPEFSEQDLFDVFKLAEYDPEICTGILRAKRGLNLNF